jgi:hypothetical protein
MDDERTRITGGLTYGEMHAGAPCPGCGLPLVDQVERPWRDKGTMYYSDEDRTAAEAETAAHQERHGDCHAASWTMGDGPLHCDRCCPPPPMSPKLLDWTIRFYRSTTLYRQARRTTGAPPATPRPPRKPTRAQLERRVAELEARLCDVEG